MTARKCLILIFIPILIPLSAARADHSTMPASDAAVSPAEATSSDSNASITALQTITIRVKGSLCPACLKQLQKRLSAKDGISNVTVKSYALERYGQDDKNLSSEYKHSATYTLSFDSSKISQSTIEEQFRSDDFRIVEVHLKKD